MEVTGKRKEKQNTEKAWTSVKDTIITEENNHPEEQEGDREMTWCEQNATETERKGFF